MLYSFSHPDWFKGVAKCEWCLVSGVFVVLKLYDRMTSVGFKLAFLEEWGGGHYGSVVQL